MREQQEQGQEGTDISVYLPKATSGRGPSLTAVLQLRALLPSPDPRTKATNEDRPPRMSRAVGRVDHRNERQKRGLPGGQMEDKRDCGRRRGS